MLKVQRNWLDTRQAIDLSPAYHRTEEGIRAHVRSRDVESVVIDAGHVGLVVGGKAQRKLWPDATRWLADRSTSLPSHPL